ncbi:MAG: AbrB/MazE/SpoVT family DNA-binding domain-containing protein [Actinomycetota bacterium]
MDVLVKVTSKGQITLPNSVRDALALKVGDHVLFRVHTNRAVIAKLPDFLALAGTVPVAPPQRGAIWPEIRKATRKSRSAARH